MPTASQSGDSQAAFRQLFPIIRDKLWAPDGKPPEAWDERREGSVLKRLLIHRSLSQLEVAILGLASLTPKTIIQILSHLSRAKFQKAAEQNWE